MRLAYYAGASTAAAAACLVKAFHERPNFYSATVYLSQSNACLLILTNLLLVGAVTFMYCLQRLLYGPLRPIEIEQLSEKAWYAVLDTLLAMPSFREDVGAWLLTMFVLLLAGKVWGWIAEGRVDVLEQQPPANPRLFHARLATSLFLSVAFDVYMTYYCLETVAANPRPGMMVIFTFEFAILTIFSIFTLLRYVLNVIAIEVTKQQTLKAIDDRKKEILAERAAARRSEETPTTTISPDDEPIEVDENEVDVPGWEEKRRYLFGLEVFTDFAKLMLYIVFFTVSVTFNGLPMHIMRDVYMTFASFSKRLSDYMNYKRATSDMNARYPDATSAEIRDDSCIVCRETMVAWETDIPDANGDAARPRRDEGLRAKKLPCGHILHLRCLKAWLERQQVCPTCRRTVLTPMPTSQPQAGNGQQAPAPGVPAQANQNVAQPRRQNRARFFNLGPVRIGFLNGPAGQINELVDQLQGAPARQGNPPPAQPGQPAAQNAQVSAVGNTRLTQADVGRMQQQIAQEAERLTSDRTQLHVLHMMTNELARLQAVQAQRELQHAALAAVSTQANAPLVGLPEHTIAAGSASLPAGVTLPEGWTLMPLQPQQTQLTAPGVHVSMQSGQAPSQALNNPAVLTQSSQISSQAPHTSVTSAGEPPRQTHSAPQPPREETITDSLVPTDDTGSPLFVPATAELQAHEPETQHPAVIQQQPHRNETQGVSSAQANGTHTTPAHLWAAQSWNFSPTTDASAISASSTQPVREQSSNDTGSNPRTVEVEDVPDSQQ